MISYDCINTNEFSDVFCHILLSYVLRTKGTPNNYAVHTMSQCWLVPSNFDLPAIGPWNNWNLSPKNTSRASRSCRSNASASRGNWKTKILHIMQRLTSMILKSQKVQRLKACIENLCSLAILVTWPSRAHECPTPFEPQDSLLHRQLAGRPRNKIDLQKSSHLITWYQAVLGLETAGFSNFINQLPP